MTKWIEWNGGECPIKSDKTRVEYQHRNGRRGYQYGHNLRWSHGVGNCDIIAYRVTDDYEPTTKTPKRLGELTDAEIGAIFRAGRTGKGIDFFSMISERWERCISVPIFCLSTPYRITEDHEPKEPIMTREQITAQIAETVRCDACGGADVVR